jgi:hypothetical protein
MERDLYTLGLPALLSFDILAVSALASLSSFTFDTRLFSSFWNAFSCWLDSALLPKILVDNTILILFPLPYSFKFSSLWFSTVLFYKYLPVSRQIMWKLALQLIYVFLLNYQSYIFIQPYRVIEASKYFGGFIGSEVYIRPAEFHCLLSP